ncbi:MAG: MaoC family dehydratase N-terminal domain-containing protein, partial [Acidimicrobiia bacterium]|nr:MaoC family dehydratase N-terminal domain-containing protein [Acidimicrobiia bacterium]
MTDISVDIDEPNEQRFATITDDALNSLRRLIGVPITDTVEPWCYEATRDNIRHYAHGIGDDNPLWCDPGYAATTRYGTIVAPPSFVFALNRILSGYVGGLPGIHAMWAGADITWHRPILRGIEVTAEAHLKDLVEHQTAFAGRAIQQIYHVDYHDAATGDLLCSGDSWCFRTERDTARELGTKYEKAKARPPMRYTAQDLERIYGRYDAERARGAEPRYIEDVTVGEELPTMTKGPMTVTGFIAYAQGWGGLYIRANR